MSSDFYTSSHNKYWLVTRPVILDARQTDLKYCSPRQLYCLYIFFSQLIQKLGKRLQLRQIPIATACVFFRRFYLKNSICETNPYLVLSACVYVAAKVEETPVHIKSVVSEARLIFSEHNIKMFPAESNKLGEMEFYLMEDLDFHLVVFHPYRALISLTGREPSDTGKWDMSRVEEEQVMRKKEADKKKARSDEIRKGGAKGQVTSATLDDDDESEEERIRRLMGRGSGEGTIEMDEGVLQISWFIVNDSYRTDAILLYPPYIIALSALYIAFCLTSMSNSTSRTRNASTQIHSFASSLSTNNQLHLSPPPASAAEFLAGFQLNLPMLFGCVQEIVGLYPIWEAFEPTLRGAQGQQKGTGGLAGTGKGEQKDKFGVEEAEALVRRMIEGRMTDLGHPDDGGADRPGASSRKRTRVD
ncbi:cyclin C [Cryptococcus wingfieldii CBS 7118]|uniref:Cyclin C n=1 Tax=Cryptococcus wingfieldii CBS 7118 TaxID=1295528 RepID=A0A1E3IPP0_9TREE|nr:cyclin C [Cryptococcus wingfieldii CBS 7118]ODN89661.1 cyclin C [Cryptococcus wingfieldii CBS 7118]